MSSGPVTFQQYKDYYYNQTRIKYFCDLIISGGNIKVCPELKLRKFALQKELHHNKRPKIQICTLMLLRNLREPVWNSVSCDAKLLHFTICSVVEKTKSNYITGEDNLSELDLLKCKAINLLINNKCYSFLWNHSWNTTSQLCYNFKARIVSPSEFTSISHIFDAVFSINLFPFLFFQVTSISMPSKFINFLIKYNPNISQSKLPQLVVIFHAILTK